MKTDKKPVKVNVKKILNRCIKITKRIAVLLKKEFIVLVKKIKEISKNKYGNIDGKYVLVGGLLFVLLLFSMVKNIMNSDQIDYPVLYNNTDGNLYLLSKNYKNEEDAIKLSNNERVEDIVYANTSKRYVLFKKSNDLYLYDSRKKDESVKIISNVVSYFFSANDKYIVALDRDDNLRVYNYRESFRVEKDVSSIIALSEDRVLYEKEKILYVRSINPKKDDRLKVTEEYDTNVKFSEDGNTIIYIDNIQKLHLFNIKKDEDVEVAKNVTKFYCDKKSCNKLYYEARDDVKSIYYYDGKDSTRVLKEIYNINDYDVERKQLVYTSLSNGEYSLYYKKGNSDAVLIEDDLQGLKEVKMFEGKDIYIITSDNELLFAKINGSKIRLVKTIADDVAGFLHAYKDGYVFISDADDGSGDINIVKGGRVKKIDSDVYTGFITISEDGKNIYYLRDYKTTGELCLSTGGKGKMIEDDVHNYEYMNKNLIYYIRDYSTSKGAGDLYRYTNKSIKIAEDVSRIASSPVRYKK